MAIRRPTKYTPKLGQLICNKIATGTAGLVKLCNADDMPLHDTVISWLRDHSKKDFLQNYLLAREAQADLLNEEMIEIADEQGAEKDSAVNVSRARLRIDARKFKAGKLAPAKQGDRLAAINKANDEMLGNTIEWGGVIMGI